MKDKSNLLLMLPIVAWTVLAIVLVYKGVAEYNIYLIWIFIALSITTILFYVPLLAQECCKKQKNEGKDPNRSIRYTIIILGITLVLLLLIHTLCVVTGRLSFSDEESGVITSVIAIVLTCIGFCITVAIAIPAFISEKQIGSILDIKYKETFGVDFNKLQMELLNDNAHTSRMFTYFLSKDTNNYWWVIGWAYKSLKLYTNYLILNNNEKYQDNIQHIDEIYEVIYKLSNAHPYKNEDYNIKIRAIKDIIDFYFIVQFNQVMYAYIEKKKKKMVKY